MFWPDFFHAPLNLWNIGAWFRQRELDLESLEPAKRDLAYLQHEAEKIGLTPTLADKERFVEWVGRLANDNVSEDDARVIVFNGIYRAGE